MTYFFYPCNNRFLSYNLYYKIIMRKTYFYKYYLSIITTATTPAPTTAMTNVMMQWGFMNTSKKKIIQGI